MLRLDDVRARIEAKVPELVGNLGNAGDFTQVIERNQLPQWRAGGFVLPGPLAGAAVQSASGIFVQGFHETVSVVLVARVQGDPTGARAVDELTPLIRSVVNAICGWAPDETPGVFALERGEPVGSQGSTMLYHLDFALLDQLRIAVS